MSRLIQRGFTLVEVLVVIVITALVSGLMFQALAYVSRLQERFGEQALRGQEGAMRVDWYRQILQGLQSDYPDSKRKFQGRGDHLEGQSISGLDPSLGALAWVELDIRQLSSGNGGALVLKVNEQQTELLKWGGAGPARFEYLDDAGEASEVWPPSGSTEEKNGRVQLPVAILLTVPDGPSTKVIAATPRSSREQRQRQVSVDPLLQP